MAGCNIAVRLMRLLLPVTRRIDIVGYKIQQLTQIVIIYLIIKAHIIMCDKMIRTILPDNICLPFGKINDQIRTEAFPVQHGRWILAYCGNQWCTDL